MSVSNVEGMCLAVSLVLWPPSLLAASLWFMRAISRRTALRYIPIHAALLLGALVCCFKLGWPVEVWWVLVLVTAPVAIRTTYAIRRRAYDR